MACAAAVATLGTDAAPTRNAASPDNRHHLGRLSAGALANGARNSEDATLNNFPPGGAVWKPATGSWNTPVLTANASSWEHTAVQEPQVIYIPEDKVLRMWYRGAGWGHPSGVGVAGLVAPLHFRPLAPRFRRCPFLFSCCVSLNSGLSATVVARLCRNGNLRGSSSGRVFGRGADLDEAERESGVGGSRRCLC